MKRVWLAGMIAVLALSACGSGAASVVRPKVPTPGKPVPAAAISRLTVIAERAIAANGGKSVAWATAVVTTHAKALTSATPGDTEPSGGNTIVYLLTIKGHFVCHACSGPPGSKAPTGTYLSMVLVAKTFSGTDFGLSPKAPSVSPSSLGPVTYLHVH